MAGGLYLGADSSIPFIVEGMQVTVGANVDRCTSRKLCDKQVSCENFLEDVCDEDGGYGVRFKRIIKA